MLFDPDTPFVLDRATLRSKSKNTPYDLAPHAGPGARAPGSAGREVFAARGRMTLALAALLAYLLGSIPSGFVLTRWAGLGDIRKIGSGNIGATNAMRAGKPLGAACSCSTCSRARCRCSLRPELTDEDGSRWLRGTAAVLGHCFPLYLVSRAARASRPSSA